MVQGKTIFALIALATAIGLYDFGWLNHSLQSNKAHSHDLTKDWIKFIPFTGKFNVLLPKEPKYAMDIINIPGTQIKRWYETYLSEEVNGTLFLINLISYHPDFDVSDANQILQSVVNEIVSNDSSHSALEVKQGIFKNKDALLFDLKNDSIHAQGVVFLIGSTVYQLTYTALKENFDKKECEKFLDSFELLK